MIINTKNNPSIIIMASPTFFKKMMMIVVVVVQIQFLILHASCEADLNQFLESLADSGSVTSLRESMQCMQRLSPCKPYMKDPPTTSPPPSACCIPLQEMILNDTQCLCKFFDDPHLLASLNTTQEDALKLPKACDITVDVAKCEALKKQASAPSHSATTKGESSADIAGDLDKLVPTKSDDAGANTESTTSGSTKIMTHFGVMSAFAACLISSQLF